LPHHATEAHMGRGSKPPLTVNLVASILVHAHVPEVAQLDI